VASWADAIQDERRATQDDAPLRRAIRAVVPMLRAVYEPPEPSKAKEVQLDWTAQ
jgi:hypothetical protein